MKFRVIATGKKNCYIIYGAESNIQLDFGVSHKEIIKQIGAKEYIKIGLGLLSHEHKDHSQYADTKKFHVLKPKGVHSQITHKEWEISAFPVRHNVPCYGFYIKNLAMSKKILYVTDTYKIDYCFNAVDYFLIEANYNKASITNRDSNYKSHMEFYDLCLWFEKQDLTNAKKIILIHLSEDNSNPPLYKDIIEHQFKIPCTIAKGGLEC